MGFKELVAKLNGQQRVRIMRPDAEITTNASGNFYVIDGEVKISAAYSNRYKAWRNAAEKLGYKWEV